MATTPEGAVKAAIKRWLDHHGFWKAGGPQPESVQGWYFMPVGSPLQVSGIPDFVGCYLGKLFCIEAKAPKGHATENQLQRHTEIRAAGGVVLVVSDVEQLATALDNL